MEGIVEKRFGSFIKKWKARYLILNRDVLQSYRVNQEGGPDILDLKAEIFLPELIHIEAMPNYGLNLTFEDETLWQLRFSDMVDYQCWLSCFVVFHADSLQFVPSTYLDGIWTSFQYIQEHAWKVEGIFRVPGLKREKLKLTRALIRAGTIGGEAVNLEGVDIPTLCSASKTLIDKLPATLLTEHLYDKFVSADKEDGVKLANLVYQLPPQNQAILQHILYTLTKIADETELTKMNAQNLGILFGTMFVSREKSVQDYVLDIQDLQQLISSLINFYDIIFKDSQPCYPLYVPRLQRELLEAQKIDIQILKRKLTQDDTLPLSSLGGNLIKASNCDNESSSSGIGQPLNQRLTSLAFLNMGDERKTAEALASPEAGNVRPSQLRQTHMELARDGQESNSPSRKLEQLFMTIRENAIPRDREFAGGCCVLRRRPAQTRDSGDIDRRRSTRFNTSRAYLGSKDTLRS